MDLFSRDRLPLVPEATLKAHRAYHPYDTRFRASARLLQSLWREDRGLPMGRYINRKGTRREMGNMINTLAQVSGATFISEDVHRLVRREIAYRQPGAIIDEPRLRGNLLSSMPLTFNALGPLKLDLSKATAVFNQLFPHLVGEVCHITFEYSPGRGDPAFIGDGTAFDAFVTCRAPDGRKTFLSFEFKYSECMFQPEARLRPRYDEFSEISGLYQDHAADELRRNPIQQLWRSHMLSQSLVHNRLFDDGAFVTVAPELNTQVQRAAALYTEQLAADETKVAFHNISLESFVSTMRGAGCEDEAMWLTERYLDFGPVHALI